MTKSKQWIAGAAALMVLVLAAGFLLLVQPKRSEAADLREQAAAQEATRASLERKLQELVAQQKGLPQAQAELAKLQKQIPPGPQLPSIVRALSEAADVNGVTIVTLSPSVPVDVQTTGGAQTLTPSPTGAAASPTGAAATPAGTVLQRIPLNIEATGTYAELTRFLSGIESLQRPFLVEGVEVKPMDAADGADGTLRITLGASVFMTGTSATAAQAAALAPTPNAGADAAASNATE
jgi:Tfp pilus assembly protein PilO